MPLLDDATLARYREVNNAVVFPSKQIGSLLDTIDELKLRLKLAEDSIAARTRADEALAGGTRAGGKTAAMKSKRKAKA